MLATGNKIEPDLFPRMHTLSAGHVYKAVIRPVEPQRPEYLTIPVQPGMSEVETALAVSRWNMLWEAGQFRRRCVDQDDLPPALAKIADHGDVNINLVPRSTTFCLARRSSASFCRCCTAASGRS